MRWSFCRIKKASTMRACGVQRRYFAIGKKCTKNTAFRQKNYRFCFLKLPSFKEKIPFLTFSITRYGIHLKTALNSCSLLLVLLPLQGNKKESAPGHGMDSLFLSFCRCFYGVLGSALTSGGVSPIACYFSKLTIWACSLFLSFL